MTDLGWTIAAMLGFALVCVMTTVYLLSKRTVNVHQENHAAPVIVNAGGDGTGLGLAPTLIGGAFKLITAGIVLTLIANLAIAAVSGIGAGLQSIGNGLSQQAAPQPQQITVVYPTPQPVQRVEPQYVPHDAPHPAPHPAPQTTAVEIDLTTVVVVAMAVVAVSLWGYVGVTLLRRRTIKRSNVIAPRPVSAREVFGVSPAINHEVKHVR